MSYGASAVQDFKGNRFRSVAAMARYWRMDPKIIADRLNRGWSARDALLLGVGRKRPKENELFTIQRLADIYEVDLDILNIALDNTKDFEEAVRIARWMVPSDELVQEIRDMKHLQHPSVRKHHKTEVMDHTGVTHASFNKMCKAWNKSTSTVRHRIDTGWSLGDALTK